MKKSTIFLLLFALVYPLILVSCGGEPLFAEELPDFSVLSYEISEPYYVDNFRISVSVTVKNNSDKDFIYYGAESTFYINSASAYIEADGKRYELAFDPVPYNTVETKEHIIKANESVISKVYFMIPPVLALGDYTLEFTHFNNNLKFEDFLTFERNPYADVYYGTVEKFTKELIVTEDQYYGMLFCDKDDPRSVYEYYDYFDGKYSPELGETVYLVYDGSHLESYPARFRNIYEMQVVLSDGTVISATRNREHVPIVNSKTVNEMSFVKAKDSIKRDDFSYEITDFTSVTNEYFDFAVTVTNISDKTVTVNDQLITDMKVYTFTDGKEYPLTNTETDKNATTDAPRDLLPGESFKVYYRFLIPDEHLKDLNEVTTNYKVRFVHNEESITFNYAFELKQSISFGTS